jgi:hypothetical protein
MVLNLVSIILPAIVSVFLLTLSVALVVLRWTVQESYVVALLVALLLIECTIIPLTILYAAFMCYCLRSITGPTAMTIIAVVVIKTLILTRTVRRVLYPNIGLD